MVIICNCLKDKIAKLGEDKTVQIICLGKKKKKKKRLKLKKDMSTMTQEMPCQWDQCEQWSIHQMKVKEALLPECLKTELDKSL